MLPLPTQEQEDDYQDEEPGEEQAHGESVADQPFLFVVLSGSQKEGSFPLNAGRFRLGSSEECDLVLRDQGIAEHHLDLIFADESLSILRCHGDPVFLDQEEITELPYDLPPLEIITIADVCFTYGPKGSHWPVPPSLDAKEQQEPEEESLQTQHNHSLETPSPTAPKSRRQIKRPAVVALFAVCLLCLPGLWFAFQAGLFASFLPDKNTVAQAGAHKAQTPKSSSQKQQKLLQKFEDMLVKDPAFAQVRLIHQDQRSWIAGYVMRDNDLVRLQNLARSTSFPVTTVSLNQLKPAIALTIDDDHHAFSYDFSLNPQGKIDLTIQGMSVKSFDEKELRSELQQTLPVLASVTFNITDRRKLLTWITEQTESDQDISRITFTFEGNALVVQGAILENFVSRLQKLIAKIEEKIPHSITIVEKEIIGPHFDSQILSLGQGHINLVRLRLEPQGEIQTFAPGDSIPGGLTLRKISRDHLILSQGDQDNPVTFVYTFSLSQPPLNRIQKAERDIDDSPPSQEQPLLK